MSTPPDPFTEEDSDIEMDVFFGGKKTIRPGDTLRIRVNWLIMGDIVLRADRPLWIKMRVTE